MRQDNFTLEQFLKVTILLPTQALTEDKKTVQENVQISPFQPSSSILEAASPRCNTNASMLPNTADKAKKKILFVSCNGLKKIG